MSGWTLTLRGPITLRLDLRGLTPAALAALDAAAVERLPLGHGRELRPLAEFFSVAPRDDDTLVLDGDLARADRIGWQLDGGTLLVDGPAGDHVGTGMRAGTLEVRGNAGDLTGCEMAGGLLSVSGDVGDFAAGALPGSMDGMRGGTLRIGGRAGARLGDRMRRGFVIACGDVGDFPASRMVAGTIAIAGRSGIHPGYGMRRGSVVFAGEPPALPPTFVAAGAEAPVFWQLLARDLARHGGPFAGLAARAVTRHLGDLAAGGKGELIVPR